MQIYLNISLDRTLCEEEDGKKDAEIPLESRIR